MLEFRHQQHNGVNEMTNANWMVTLANSNRKALAGFGYTAQQIGAMDLKETEQELKNLGYNFKANSPFKNK
tara:strand:+ start:1268 stop:1480 length:213 start_codon:yes stop_codon:yes gene_type:complete